MVEVVPHGGAPVDKRRLEVPPSRDRRAVERRERDVADGPARPRSAEEGELPNELAIIVVESREPETHFS